MNTIPDTFAQWGCRVCAECAFFAPGDPALRQAIQVACQPDHRRSGQEVLAIAEEWRPYCSLATSYLFAAAFEPAEVPSAARLGSA